MATMRRRGARETLVRFLLVGLLVATAVSAPLVVAALAGHPATPTPDGPGSPIVAALANPALDKSEKATCSAVSTCNAGALALTYPGDTAIIFVSENGTTTWTGSVGQAGLVGGMAAHIIAWSKGAPGATNLNETVFAAYQIPGSGSTSFWVNASGSTTYVVHVAVFYGLGTSPLDHTGTGTSGHGTAITAAVTVAATSDIVFMGTAIGGSVASTAGSGTSVTVTLLQSTSTATYSEGSFSGVPTGTGSVTMAGTGGAIKSWDAVAIALKIGTTPNAPTGVTQNTPPTTTTVGVQWTAPNGIVANYTAYRYVGLACTGSQFSTSTAAGTTTYTLTGQTAGTERAFQIDAWNGTGEGTRTACYGAISTESAPTGVSAAPASKTSITVSWTNPTTVLFNLIYWELGSSCSSPTTVNVSVTTSYTITGLTTGLQYCAYVADNDGGGGTSASSSTVTSVTSQVPGAPTGLTVGAVTATTVPLTWTNPAPSGGGLVNDTVYWWTGGTCASGVTNAHSLAAVGTSYTITGLSGASEVATEVAVWNATGQSPDSSCATAWTLPTAPTGLTLTGTTATTLTFTWTNPGGTLTGVTVDEYHGLTCGTYFTAATLAAYTATYTMTGQAAASPESVIVFETSAGGNGANSACVGGTTLPAGPTGLTVTAVTTTTIALTWTNPTGTLTNDTLSEWAGSVCAGGVTMASLGVVTSGTWSALAPASPFSFEVQAWSAGGGSAESSCVPGTTLPNAPTGLTVGTITATTIALTWSLPSGTLVNVTVYWFTGSTCTGAPTVHSSGSGATTAYTVTGLASGPTYAFEVQAWSAGGPSVDSGCVHAMTLSFPGAPFNLIIGGETVTAFSASWSLPGSESLVNVTFYYRAGSTCGAGMTAASLGSGSAVTYTVTGLPAAKEYAVEVTDWNATGQGPASACVIAWTFPYAPSYVEGVGANVSEIVVTWTLSPGTVSNYSVDLGIVYGTYATHVSVGNVTHATIGGLAANTTYFVIVIAWVNATEGSVLSNVAPVHTPPVSTAGLTVAIVTAAAVNETVITVSWLAPPGHIVNYTLVYWRWAWLPIAYISAGTVTVYNVTGLAPGITYYFAVYAWSSSVTEGPVSNVAPAQTDVIPPVIPPFPWASLEAATTLGILGSVAFSCAAAVWVAGRRTRRTQGAATIALARSAPRRPPGRGPTMDQGQYRGRSYVPPGSRQR